MCGSVADRALGYGLLRHEPQKKEVHQQGPRAAAVICQILCSEGRTTT